MTNFLAFQYWIILLFSFYSLTKTESFFDKDDFGSGPALSVDGVQFYDSQSFFDLGLPQPETVPTCEADEYQCPKSFECIDKYKYCDHVIDCQDESDEITCGLLDFSSPSLGPKEFGGWTNVDERWTREPNYITTGVNHNTSVVSFSLQFKIRAVAPSCVVLIQAQATTPNSKTELHFQYTDGDKVIVDDNTNTWINQKNNYTEFRYKAPGNKDTSSADNGQSTWDIRADVDVGDEFKIFKIELQDCNRGRTIGDCDFETGTFCRWKSDAMSTLQWSIDTGNVSDRSPLVDHTKGTAKGHYLFVEVRQENLDNKTTTGSAVLTSKLVEFSGCLSFWYFPANSESIGMKVYTQSQTDEKWWLRGTVQEFRVDEWNYFEIDLSQAEAYTIHIDAEIDDPDAGVAVDDILLKSGRCDKRHRVCTFEDGDCDFVINNPTDDANSTWRRMTGLDVKSFTQMDVTDHTRGTSTGYMMIFMPNGTNDVSFLTGPYWEDAGYRCLQFYYFINDDEIVQLEVIHHPNEDFGVSGWSKKFGYLKRRQSTVLLGGWRKTQVTLAPLDDARYEFIATALSDNPADGFLALDDITVTTGRCKPVMTCDFEIDDCGWTLDREESSGTFERIAGKRPMPGLTTPMNDHTLNSARGHYLLFGFKKQDELYTAVESDDFSFNTTSCLSFWSFFSKDSNIRLDFYLVSKDGSVQFGSFHTAKSTEWLYHEINVKPATGLEVYRVRLVAQPFDFEAGQSVAVDDIQFSPFKCGYKPTNPDDDIEPGKHRKDIDIPDFRCDFEGNLCKFENLFTEGFNWTVVEAHEQAMAMGGPLVDHSTHSFTGHYLKLTPTGDPSTMNGTHNATLVSKMTISPYNDFLNDTINDVCLEFYYVFDGESISSLMIGIAYGVNDEQTILFQRVHTYGPTWRHEYVPIRFYDDFHIFFTGSTNIPSKGIVGLDDIRVTVGKCPPITDGICDFGTDFCGWDNNASLPLKFKIVAPYLAEYYEIESGTNNTSILPVDRYDSPYGSYLFLNVSYANSETRKAQFISPIQTPEKRCLQFYYYFSPPEIATMNIYAVYKKLDNLKYLIANVQPINMRFWLFYQTEIDKHFLDMDFQFVIEVQRTNLTVLESHFGLDSIAILDACPPVASCDFEDGFCQFFNAAEFTDDAGIWVRAYGPSDWHKGPSPLGPPGDHTIGRGGVFVYVDHPNGALLETPLFIMDQESCLSFWYYMNTTDGANAKMRLILQIVSLDIPTPFQFANLGYDEYQQDLHYQGKGVWAQRTVDLNFTSNDAILQIIGSIEDKDKHFIAVDDLAWKVGKCNAKKYSNFTCVDNPTKPDDFKPNSAVCNFVKDCANGHDEENCGYSCDFKKDLCGWKIKNVTSTFVRSTKEDGFDKPMLVLQDQPGIFNERPEAMIESPWIQNSGALCGFNFDFILSDRKDKAGEVIVKIVEEFNPLGVEVYRKVGNTGASWISTIARIGRIKRRFKIQVIAKLRVKIGRGNIALTNFKIDPTECLAPAKVHPREHECKADNKFHCSSDMNICYSDGELCDFVEDCPDGSDETNKACRDPQRDAISCDFEEGICDWSLPKQQTNGFRWTKVEDIDDYTFGLKRDHTLNDQYGHVVSIWNKQNLNGTLQSPMIYGTDSCSIRFYYMFTTRHDFERRLSKIGKLRISVKYSENGRLYPLKEIQYFSYKFFQRFEYSFFTFEKAPFYVVIQVFPGNDYQGMWAIDDISFSSTCFSKDLTPSATTDAGFTPFPIVTKAPNNCTTGFLCDGGEKCILKSEVCDFIYDCNDGTDEDLCGKDELQTGWTDKSEGRVYWWYDTHNATLQSQIRDGDGSTAELVSTVFGRSYSKCHMTFDYKVEDQSDVIKFILLNDDTRAQLFDSAHSQALAYGKWVKANVYIGAQSPGWYLRLTGTKGEANDKTETMQLRNFHIQHCDVDSARDWRSCQEKGLFTCPTIGCVPWDQVCDFSPDCPDGGDERNCKKFSSFMCSFETGKNDKNGTKPTSSVKGPTCDLKMDNMKRFKGKDLSGFYGPGIDHTTDSESGHFLMTDEFEKSDVVLPVFEPTHEADCYFRFWYMVDGDATITIQNTVYGAKDQIKVLDTLYSKDLNDSFIWKRYETSILSKFEFQPMISSQLNKTETKSFVAIDDISFSAGCLLHKGKPINNVTTPAYSSNCLDDEEFTCQDGSCLPLALVCDFFPNCKAGEDEDLCPKVCDFDQIPASGDPTCGWGESESDPNPVMIGATIENANSASVLTSYYPDKDATTGTQTGYFMMIYPLNYTNKVDTKVTMNIYSADFSSATSECTLELDYYIATLDEDKEKPKATYSIGIIYDTLGGVFLDDIFVIDAGDSSLHNKWNHVLIGVGRRAYTFQMLISRSNESYMAESFSIDNVKFSDCAYTAPHLVPPNTPVPECPNAYTCLTYYNCIPYEQMCDMKMDCPLGDDESNCKQYAATFEASGGEKFKIEKKSAKKGQGWEKIAGAAPEKSTMNAGPPFDHTYFNKSGHYLYGRYFDQTDDSSYIISASLSKISPGCELGFYYFMNEYVNDSIKVFKNSNKKRELLTEIHSNLTDKWLKATVKLEDLAKDEPLMIELQGCGGDKSSIAIDDVSFSETCTGGLPYTGISTSTTKETSNDFSTVTKTTTTKEPPAPITDSPIHPNTPTDGPPSQCDDGFYWCAIDSKCLPTLSLCNFVKDCSDGIDEIAPLCTQTSCEFKSKNTEDDCGISLFATNSGYNWTFMTQKDFAAKESFKWIDLLPDSFLLVNQSTRASFSPAAVSTHVIIETGHRCVLRFKYICDLKNCPIQVTQATYGADNSGNEKQIWIPMDDIFREPDYDPKYRQMEAKIFIGRQANFILSIFSMHHYGSVGYIIMESIKFEDCESTKFDSPPFINQCADNEYQCIKSYGNCIPKESVCDYEQDCRLSEDEKNCDHYVGRCNFENIVNECQFWEFENNDERWGWTVESGLDGLPFLPRIDHTGPSEEKYYFSFHTSIMRNYVNNDVKDFTTRYKSDIISKNVTSDCRFRIWHNIIGRNCSLVIYKRYSPKNLVSIANLVTDGNDFWTKLELDLSEAKNDKPQDFDIIIEANVNVDHKCSVNIDDISMTPQCYPTGKSNSPDEAPDDDLKNVCSPNLMCRNKRCYSVEERCNFIDDCRDGTDEEKCQATCDFDTIIENVPRLCGWYTPKLFQGNFNISNGASYASIASYKGPKIDHTSGSITGHFIRTNGFTTENQKLELHSALYKHSSKNCRFTFAAFFESADEVSMKIYLKNPYKTVQVWPCKTSKEDKKVFVENWGIGNVFIGKQDNFSLMFELIHSSSYLGNNVYLDDLNFIDCARNETLDDLVCGIDEYRCDDQSACVPYFKICDGQQDCGDMSDEKHCIQTNGTCWFEDENWKTLCNWIDLQKDFNWTWMNKPLEATDDHETNTGPQELLNEKYNYMLMNAKTHNFTERAAIATQEFPASAGICTFNFHHYMYGAPAMGELIVYSLGTKTGKRTELFRRTRQTGPQWNYEDNIMVSSKDEPFRVVFEAMVGGNIFTDIAIAYVSFSKDCAAGKWTHGVRDANLTDLDTCEGFYCHRSHECIPRDWVCDGEVDCRDGSDEINCSKVIHNPGRNAGRVAAISLSIFAAICIVSIISVFMYRRMIITADPATDTNTNSFLYRRMTRRRINSPISIEMTSRK